MEEVFSLKKYIRQVKNTKLRFFLNYIMTIRTTDDDIELLKNVNKSVVLNSLDKYIESNNVNKYGAARSYIGYIMSFYEEIFYDYEIKNDTFFLKDMLKSLENDVLEKIAYLPKSTEKEMALEADIIRLNKLIDFTWKSIIREDLIREVDEKVHYTIPFLQTSCIACKLLITYGFKNKSVASIKLKDYDRVNKTLFINDVKIPLKKDIYEMIDEYLIARNYIVKKVKVVEDYLLIQPTGEGFFMDDKVYYTKLYRVLSESPIKVSAEGIAHRIILNMIEKKVDIINISKITGHSELTCRRILKSFANETVDIFSVFNSFNEEIDLKIEIKDKMQCLHCSRSFDNNPVNWVIVQYENDNNKYIVCKECKGKNEYNTIG